MRNQQEKRLNNWLNTSLGKNNFKLSPITGDASFRQYFRIYPNHLDVEINNQPSQIAVISPPATENNAQFIKIATLLNQHKITAPIILDKDLVSGFLRLSDLGDTQYFKTLQETPEQADQLYDDAIHSLTHLQTIPHTTLPSYDRTLLNREMELFMQWYVIQQQNIKPNKDDLSQWEHIKTILTDSALEQPQVFVHRDYHSRNLMQCEGQDALQRVGIIDFQDAVYGAITYDLVSLLRDCYIEWSTKQINHWLQQYYEKALSLQLLSSTIKFTQFEQWFDLMGIQRHLKAIGIFSRLAIRDKKLNYLKDIPRTLKYIRIQIAKYPQLKPLSKWIN